MKLLIDVDDLLYNMIQNGFSVSGMRSGKTILQLLVIAIQKGKPLDDIKDDIRYYTQRYTLSRESGGFGQVDWSEYLIRTKDVIKILDGKFEEVKDEN